MHHDPAGCPYGKSRDTRDSKVWIRHLQVLCNLTHSSRRNCDEHISTAATHPRRVGLHRLSCQSNITLQPMSTREHLHEYTIPRRLMKGTPDQSQVRNLISRICTRKNQPRTSSGSRNSPFRMNRSRSMQHGAVVGILHPNHPIPNRVLLVA